VDEDYYEWEDDMDDMECADFGVAGIWRKTQDASHA